MINWKELVEKSGVAIAFVEAAKNQIVNSIDHELEGRLDAALEKIQRLQDEVADLKGVLERTRDRLVTQQSEAERLQKLLDLEVASRAPKKEKK